MTLGSVKFHKESVKNNCFGSSIPFSSMCNDQALPMPNS
jgi:hypothetical protein